MAIRVKHGMDPGLAFDAAYQAGQGRFEEDRRRFDLGQQLRERQLAEQQRQFNVATDQRQRQFDAARVDRAADRFDQQQRLQLGAALDAQQRAMQSDAYLQREAMRQQGILQEQAMRNDQERYEADLKRRSQEFAIEQGWIERDAEYMNGQVDGVVDQLMEDRDSFDEQGRLAFSKQMQALRQTQQRYAAGYLRPKQYIEALGQWMEGVASERWDTYKKQEPTPEQMYNQGVYEAPDGRTWYFGDSRGVRVEDPIKKEESDFTNDKVKFSEKYQEIYDDLAQRNMKVYQAEMQEWSRNGALAGREKPQLAAPDPREVESLYNQMHGAYAAYRAGEPWVEPEPEGGPGSEGWSGTGQIADDPIIPPPGVSVNDILRIYAGKYVVDPENGNVFLVPDGA